MPNNHKLKAFTIMELLVSMTLTGILVVFAFMGYNQVQKLFVSYTVQSKFISDYNELHKALSILSERAEKIEASNEKTIAFKNSSGTILLDMSHETMLLQFPSHTDTFDLKPGNIQIDFLRINKDLSSSLVKTCHCEVFFRNRKFRVSFHKEYDAATVLYATLELLPPDEQP